MTKWTPFSAGGFKPISARTEVRSTKLALQVRRRKRRSYKKNKLPFLMRRKVREKMRGLNTRNKRGRELKIWEKVKRQKIGKGLKSKCVGSNLVPARLSSCKLSRILYSTSNVLAKTSSSQQNSENYEHLKQ